MIVQITSEEDLNSKLAEVGDKLVVIDFFATWCGPCKMIAPQLEELSKEKTDIIFFKIDVDQCEGVGAAYEISSMPTFVFIKNGKILETFTGANMNKLKATIEKHQRTEIADDKPTSP